MKIGNGKPPVNLEALFKQQDRTVRDFTKADKGAGSGDAKVSVSDSAATAAAIHDELAGLPEVRTDVVERIRSEVQAGTYKRSPDDVARKMIVTSLFDSVFQDK